MTPLAIVVIASVYLSCGEGGAGSACSDLDPDLRRAIGLFIRANHPTGQPLSEDHDELRWATQVLRDHGKESVPCLAEVFRRGLAGTDLWTFGGAPPAESRWAVDLVRAVDPAAAVRLYREWRKEPGLDALSRVHTAVELGSLGEVEFLPEVVAFLEAPPQVGEGELGRLRPLQERAIEVISSQNYRPGLRALRALASGGPPYAKAWRWLPIYIAQLSEDHEAVVRYASDPERFSWALRALKRMGRDDLLRKFAEDPTYKFRSLARDLLAGEPNP